MKDHLLPIEEALKIAHMEECELCEFAPATNVVPKPQIDGTYGVLMGVKRNIVVNIEFLPGASPEEIAKKLLAAKYARISITV